MLYKDKENAVLSEAQFQNPSSEYRGAPFWAWNCKVTREDVDFILDNLKEMGMGGAHIHSRTGLDLPYLSQEFMDMASYAHEKGKQLGMLTWLYDEDRFPSGAAGGLVTVEREFRQRFLVLSPEPEDSLAEGQRRYLGKYIISLKDGYLEEYRFLKPEETDTDTCEVQEEVWYLYREIAGDNPWFNNQAYLDTLNRKAVDQFIQVTYEAYYREFGEEFGKTIPAIFTDEPQFSFKTTLGYAGEKKRIVLPYTDDFPDTYREKYGVDFLEGLPECIWNLPEGALSYRRYYYHDHICERFTHAFVDNIGEWCTAHGIALTGHMMEEPTLRSQTAALGEAMRSYRSFGIPGIDMLYDSRELNTAKQAQSAVHQFGAEGMVSELYGVTNWDFDFRGHKLAGDWQAALGVTVRVHHLTWTSMEGEAKRDYPASIGYQSPWYKEYPLIEDYFARVNTALTRGSCVVKVGVIHPVESYWLYWGPREQTQGIRNEMEEKFKNLTQWLLFGLIDFDFIAESLWEQLTPDEQLAEDEFKVGKMRYDAIIVPNCVTLRGSTLKRLKAFQRAGGRVIFAGEIPTHVDAVSSREVAELAKGCEQVAFAENKILELLEPLRMIDIHNQHGARVNNILSQIRDEGKAKWLFLAHCHKMANPDIPEREEVTIAIKGVHKPVRYDGMTGDIRAVPCHYEKGNTIIKETLYDHDSLLYYLTPEATEQAVNDREAEHQAEPVKQREILVKIPDFLEVKLEEPNVLILDMPEARLDEGVWQEREEILRMDNRFRRILGYPLRTEAFPQPWLSKAEKVAEHRLTLRYIIFTEVDIESPSLALERATETEITLNGQEVQSRVTGYYTDRSIQVIQLPPLVKGQNILMAEMPYHQDFHVEAMYLLGDFGVRTAGKNAALTGRSQEVAFGDICVQGYPFYGGNYQYQIPVTTDCSGSLKIDITQYRASLLGVRLDGEEQGKIAFSPYSLIIEGVAPGDHMLELTVYGNRVNTFGALHNCNHAEPWPGHPDSFRTEGAAWSYEYQLRPVGILVTPVITFISI